MIQTHSIIPASDATLEEVVIQLIALVAKPCCPPATITGVLSINGDGTLLQTLTTGISGTDFNIVDNLTGDHKFNLPIASAVNTGKLSAADWTTFNNKLSTIAGIAAGGELSGTYPNPTLVNSAVIGKVLTGLNVIGSTIVATDTILQAFGKTQNQINGLLGGVNYQGTWNATTNIPALASGVGTKGYYYVVSVAGATNLDGTTDWKIGDWVIFNGVIWEKVDNTDAVSSVNGYIGAVNLVTSDIPESVNLYYTNARGIGSVLTGYVSGAGVIAATDTILQAIQKLNGNIGALVTGVSSVNGFTGVVTLTTTNIAEGTNLYFTDERVDDRVAVLIQNGTGLNWTYVDGANTLTGNVTLTPFTTTDLAEGVNLYFTNARAIAATLTGYVSGAGVISAADSILSAIQKLNGNIGALVTGVSSVFGRTGAVVAVLGDYTTTLVPEGTNLYYTNARVDTQVATYTGNVTLTGTVFSIGALQVTNSMIANATIDLTTKVTGILPIANGGTNSSTANGALNNLLPSQLGNAGFVLTTDGTNTSWVLNGSGTVTSVSVTTANGVSGVVATATTTPAITITLGAITPTSVNGITFSGSGSISNTGISSLAAFVGSGTSSGSNTGDQTITLTGDVTGSGTGTFATTVAGTIVKTVVLNTPNVIFSTPVTFVTAANTATGTLALNTQTANTVFAGPISGGVATPTFRVLVAADLPAGTGTVTSVSIVTANGISGVVATPTTTPAITLTLGAITPTSVNGITFSGSGSIANTGVSSLTAFTGSGSSSGANTGDQTITLTGEATGSGTGSFAVTLTNSAVIGKVLTGYVSGAGVISAADSILSAIQKLNGNIGALVTGVSSVFGRTGAVVAVNGDYTTTLVTEGTNLYYTNARGIGSVLTGYISGAGVVAATDTILQAIQKLNGNIGALVTGVSSVNGLTGAVPLTGTVNRITISAANVFDIAATYVGQSSITTLGTITTGVWNGTVVSPVYGGTGIANNVASTITISGSFATTLTITGITTITLPTSGTLYGTLANSITSAQLLLSMSNKTGTGLLVFNTSPALVTPDIGVAIGTSLAVTGALTSSGTAGIGYATGAGGAVTQLTNRTTGVTLSKMTGSITTNTTSLAALAAATFTVTNTLVGINDIVVVSKRSGATNVKTDIRVNTTAAGSFTITVHNIDAAVAEVGAIVINFAIIKGVVA